MADNRYRILHDKLLDAMITQNVEAFFIQLQEEQNEVRTEYVKLGSLKLFLKYLDDEAKKIENPSSGGVQSSEIGSFCL